MVKVCFLFEQSSKSSEDLELLRAERGALARRQGERGGELERLRSEVEKAEQREKDEEDELTRLRNYQGQIKDMQIKRMQVRYNPSLINDSYNISILLCNASYILQF
jgi:hypothetical protein